MDEEKYLENLKEGDFVFVSYGYEGEGLEKVIKITKTQIHIKHMKFRRNTGWEIGGDSLRASRIIPLTPKEFEEKMDQHKAKKLAKKVVQNTALLEKYIEIKRVSLKDVTEILDLINSKINVPIQG